MSNFKEDLEDIRMLGEPALMEQLAEECSELAQAALKLARLERGENHTPKTDKECRAALAEKIADVALCIGVFRAYLNISDMYNLSEMARNKRERWVQRIREARGETPKEKKTRQSEFLKMFPNALMDGCTVAMCPVKVDENVDCRLQCDDCRKDFWLAEVD